MYKTPLEAASYRIKFLLPDSNLNVNLQLSILQLSTIKNFEFFYFSLIVKVIYKYCFKPWSHY